ncbi:MAG: AAA family ATPase [Desulfurococcaceae archaeon]
MIIGNYTGNNQLDELIDVSSAILLYGPAASGKTTMLLTIAGNLCSEFTCVYISTEETLHYDRVAKTPSKYGKAFFAEAFDMETFIRSAFITYMLNPRYVFVDSINALFRLEPMKENTLTRQALVSGLLFETARRNNGKLFATAQVRIGEKGELEASGFKILDFYFDLILSLFIGEGSKRYIKPVKSPILAKFEKLSFTISDIGLMWND